MSPRSPWALAEVQTILLEGETSSAGIMGGVPMPGLVEATVLVVLGGATIVVLRPVIKRGRNARRKARALPRVGSLPNVTRVQIGRGHVCQFVLVRWNWHAGAARGGPVTLGRTARRRFGSDQRARGDRLAERLANSRRNGSGMVRPASPGEIGGSGQGAGQRARLSRRRAAPPRGDRRRARRCPRGSNRR